MTAKKLLEGTNNSFIENEYEGIYGRFTITKEDHLEVQRYRFALFSCGLSLLIALIQWLFLGPDWIGLWLMPIALALGLSLKWIHIYLRSLHRLLVFFWALGTIGSLILIISFGAKSMLNTVIIEPKFMLFIGPLFAALTGVGFKEFFCFQRIEAIGLTVMVPIALIGHLSGLINGYIVMTMLSLSAIFLIVLTIRKFGMNPADDVGDKSVFKYLEKERAANVL